VSSVPVMDRFSAEDERQLIVTEVEFLIHSICSGNAKRLRRALTFLHMIAQANSPEWFYERRHWRLGEWCELFVDDYVWTPIELDREEFLNSEGRFQESPMADVYSYHPG